MSTLVIFDSTSGPTVASGTAPVISTLVVAEVIAVELGDGASAIPVAGLGLDSLTGVGLLVVGSPVISWKPSPTMQAFLAQLHPGTLRGVRAAAFDTRVRQPLHGDAAGKISRAGDRAGAHVVAPPTGFIVEGRAGTLAAGEVSRAAAWAGSIASVRRR